MSTARERCDDVGKKIKREADVNSAERNMGRRLGPPGVLNTITPCAACKLLRRRCAQECPFSPYFSPHEPQKFASVHKVFGASNVSKMLMEVPEPQRADAANSLVYEANLRLRDPVYGCMGAISALQQQVQALESELQAVRAEIFRHKYRQATAVPASHSALISPSGEVSVAVRPPAAQTPSPQPPVPDASSSSVYASPPSTSTNYSSITASHNVAYFS